ncbi:MAG TPA: DUF58 domain-containing protein [Methylomirabilota bacterium]|nr:DUF58 domain-containing protein [Methylomirabilota bacterium]
MIRPTRRAVLLFGLGVPAALVPLLVDARLWPVGLTFFGAALLLLGVDAILAPAPRAFAATIRAPATLYLGEDGLLSLDLALPSGRFAVDVEAKCDVGELLTPPPDHRFVVGPRQVAHVEFPLQAKRRGPASLERLWLRWSGPLGLATRQRIEPLARTLPVLPSIRAVRTGAARFFSPDALFGSKAQNQQGDGSEFDALRAYMSGLDHRSIDWKHSARHHQLVCKEFRTERNHPIILAFDTGYLMSEPLAGIPKLDHAISAGLLLGYMSLKSGDQVGIFAFDSAVRRYSGPAGGTRQFARLQRLAAELAYRHEETNFTLGLTDLLGRLNRRSLVVLMTDFVDTITAELMVENLGRLAARHLVICVTLQDPALFATVEAAPASLDDVARSVVADGFIRERTVVFERLRRLGVHSLDVPAERMGMEMLNRYLLIKRRELI